MKVIFFRINRIRICVLLSVMIGWACSEQMTKSRETEETQYERMGRLHNEGLDYVLEQILITAPVTRGGERKLPTEEVIWQMCYDFTRNQGEEGLTRTSGTVGEGTPYSFLSDWQREWLIQIKETVWTLTPETLDNEIFYHIGGTLQTSAIIEDEEKNRLMIIEMSQINSLIPLTKSTTENKLVKESDPNADCSCNNVEDFCGNNNSSSLAGSFIHKCDGRCKNPTEKGCGWFFLASCNGGCNTYYYGGGI